MQDRHWQNWDKPGIADAIERTWQETPAEHRHRERLAALAAPYLAPPGQSVAEIGCGTGLVYNHLVPALIPASAYTGVDVSEQMLAIARRNFPQGRFLQGDGYDLPLSDGAFDVVLCFEVLGHLPEIETFIGQLVRVSRRWVIATFWPSATDRIVESEEQFSDVRFLHRNYPDVMVERAVLQARPDAAIEFRPVNLQKTACIVRLPD